MADKVDISDHLSHNLIGRSHGITGNGESANRNLTAVSYKAPDGFLKGHQLIGNLRVIVHRYLIIVFKKIICEAKSQPFSQGPLQQSFRNGFFMDD
jgi:hypothetical protein